MPYIPMDDRQKFRDVADLDIATPGELNYAVTLLLNNYLLRRGKSYGTINECVGVLECAKQEFYRRIAAPYEDAKSKMNGDVYPYGVTKL